MKSILPEEFHDEVPSGFNTAGHVGECPCIFRAAVQY